MTYRHHSLRCHHRIQNTQGTNEHQFRITCQQCQGHLAIVYGWRLNAESRRLIQEHLDATTLQGPVQPPVWRERRPQPRARAAAAMQKPQDDPELAERRQDVEALIRECQALRAQAVRQQDVEVLIQECQRLTAELQALQRQAPPPPPEAAPEEVPRQYQDVLPSSREAIRQQEAIGRVVVAKAPPAMPRAQGSPRQQRPPP